MKAFTLDILILKVVSSLDLGHESLRFLFRSLHHQHIVTEPNLKIRPVLLSVLAQVDGCSIEGNKIMSPKENFLMGIKDICSF